MSHLKSQFVLPLLEEMGCAGVENAIHPDDEMLHFLYREYSGSLNGGFFAYFRSGYTAATTVAKILQEHFGDRQDLHLLDFAAGFGRVTRFIRENPQVQSLTVSDIDPAAMEFQREVLGVRTFLSASDPKDLHREESYDAIYVASLFSHLPDDAFHAWLEWLRNHLRPGGILIFSTHGPEVMLKGRKMPKSGLYFETMSETDRLDKAMYGSSWVTEDYVAEALHRTFSDEVIYHRFPRALWHLQDLYVVGAESRAQPLNLEPWPMGYLETCHLEHAQKLYCAGWSGIPGLSAEGLKVEVRIVGKTAGWAEPNHPREDVGGEFGEIEEGPGWSVVVESPRAFEAEDRLEIWVHRNGAPAFPLVQNTLEGTLLLTSLQRYEADYYSLNHRYQLATANLEGKIQALAEETKRVEELDEAIRRLGWEKSTLEHRVEAMEASFFWRLRNWWFSLKP